MTSKDTSKGSTKVILHLCADTGSDTKPYQDDNEYEVVLVGSGVGVENFSVARWLHTNGLHKEIVGIIANPPCLEFSRARPGGKARLHESGLYLVKECQRVIEEAKSYGNLRWWAIENPATGALRNYLGKPAYEYQPWWYGSPWTKKTALWGEFNIPERKYHDWEDVPKNNKLWVRKRNRVIQNDRYTGKPEMHTLHKSAYRLIPEFYEQDFYGDGELPDSDMEFRSLCSQKFAKAFKEVNL